MTLPRELFLERLLDCVEKAVIATDLEGTITYFNRFAEQLFGWSAAEVIGRSILEVTPSKMSLETSVEIFERLKAGESWSGEVELSRRDGTTFIGSITDSPITDASGLLIGVVGVTRDSTETKRTEEALRASEQQYRDLVESAHEGIAIIDSQGIVQFVNRGVVLASGYGRDEIIGRPGTTFVHPEDAEQLMSPCQYRNRDLRLLRKDGSIAWTIASLSVLDDGRRLVVITDVTARKTHALRQETSQRELAASEERYRAVVEGATEVIYTIDWKGIFTSLNAAFGRLTGWKPAQWIGRPFIDLLVPGDRPHALEVYGIIMAGGRIDEAEFHLLNHDGTTSTIHVSAEPIFRDGRIAGLQGFGRDLTETKRAQAESARLETELEKAKRLTGLGRVAATIAHEFNNVLMGISPFVELLRRPNITPERRASSLEHMGAALKRGKRITEEILRYAREAPPVIERVDAITVRTALLAELASTVSSSYQLSVEVREPAPVLMADASQLNQILSNLIVNARDAMPKGGPISVMFERPQPGQEYDFGFVAHPDGFVHISVTDSGCGMPADILPQIFEPLFTTKRAGTGLGLAVTHQVVKQHGGLVFVESKEGAGSTFHLFLPAAEGEAAPAEPFSKRRLMQTQPGRVLLVEDDVSVADGLAGLLEDAGMTVEITATGAEVMPAIQRSPPDVVILDIGLPDIDGTTVYAAVAELYPDLPVVFSTGHGDERKIEQHLQRGNVAMLRKPYNVETLLETIEQVRQNPLSTGRAKA